MIARMQQVTLLLSARKREAALRSLRALGVMHVKNVAPPLSTDIDSLVSQLGELEKAMVVLSEATGGDESEETSTPAGNTSDPREAIATVLELARERSTLESSLLEHEPISEWYDRWGEISRKTIRQLRDAGLWVRLYVGDRKTVRSLPPETQIFEERDEAGTVFFAYFGETQIDRLDFREESVPEIEAPELRRLIAGWEARIEEINAQLFALTPARVGLFELRSELEKQLELSNVLHGMGEEEQFVWLQGFCPVDTVESVKETADEQGWAYLVEEPDNPDDVPTLIRNPKWLRIIEPMFNFLGTKPGYAEFDISMPFLIFFSLFFAMIVSDAGYGLIFVSLGFFAQKKFGKKAPKEPFILLYVLGGATMLWGLVSGNWFGFEGIGRLPIFEWALINAISAFPAEAEQAANLNFMMYLCFFIGAIHLTVAHAMRAFRVINSPKALAEVGWIAIVWTLFFVAGTLVISKDFPGIGMPLLIGGSVLVLLFANFQKNIVKGFLITLGDLPLTMISSFSDVVSYLRLFAVGYASVTVAASFNGMAVGDGITGIVAGLAAAITLFLGHTLNIVLCLMGVIVHGVRLNMLEFSGHMNMQWSGQEYLPFKE